jgi:signal transduction histidine kinase
VPMTMDVRTLLVAVAVASLVSVIAVSVVWMANRKVPGVGIWTLGAMFTCLSMPLFLFQGLLENRLITHVLPNVLHGSAILCYLAGVIQFREKQVHWKWLAVSGLVLLAVIFWYLFVEDNQAVRVKVASAWATGVYLVTAALIWRDRREGMRLSTRMAAMGFGIAGIGMGYRVFTWVRQPHQSWVSGTSWENASLALVALAMTFLWIFSVLFLVNQYHIREVALRSEERHAMEQQLLEAKHEIEREKARRAREIVSRELHDGIGGITATMAMLASLGRVEAKGEVSEIFSNFEEMALKGSREIQGLMTSVENEVFRWSDWLRDLESYSRKIMAMAGISFDWKVEGPVPEGIIRDARSAASLMKVAFEAAHNMVRHSGAKEGGIHVLFQEDRLSIVIFDNGRGISVNNGYGRGMGNMRRRMEEMGGGFSVRAEVGTRVSLEAVLSEDGRRDPAAL